MMSKTRPSSRSMGATPGGARGARGAQSAACATWRRATTRGGGRGTPGEGKESATEDDDREERGGKFLQSAKKAKIRGKIAKTPVFSTTLA